MTDWGGVRERVLALCDLPWCGTVFGASLSHVGCDYHMLLVVNGPDRGVMWADYEGALEGIYPLIDEVGRVDFERWYLSWLEAVEAGRPERSW